MLAMKIQNIRIKAFRGVASEISYPLDGKSSVMYGDNGSGKSSLTDSVEWFINNKVGHLSSKEIDTKEILRNFFCSDNESTEVEILYQQEPSLSAIKTIDNSKKIKFSNKSDEFQNYITRSQSENLILRHHDLGEFVLATQSEKLTSLSNIIGFSEVIKKKDVLRKAYNTSLSDLKNKNYENQISTQKAILISKLAASISNKENLFSSIKEKIKHLNLNIEISSFDDVSKLLEKLKKPTNDKLTKEYNFLVNAKSEIVSLSNEIGLINNIYINFFDEFELIAKDVDDILKIYLVALLNIGQNVLNKVHKDDTCPLCLQPKSNDDLQKELSERLLKIEESTKKKAKFDEAINNVKKICLDRINRLSFTENPIFTTQSKNISEGILNLKKKFEVLESNSKIKVTSGKKPLPIESVGFETDDFSVLNFLDKRISELEDIFKKDNTTQIFADISAARDAFFLIGKLSREKEKLEEQRKSLHVIYESFIKYQKESLENFVSRFSEEINGYYQYMNSGELFQDIRIVTVGEEDDLTGLTIEFLFNDRKVVSPQSVFSESHLNCLGISFFLASVRAFNSKNKFFVLDDVISSFDANHRKRFAELLFEKFKDYQIILLTHEIDWYKNFVKKKATTNGWNIFEIKWSNDRGTFLDETTIELRDRITHLLANGNTDLVGNPLRRYIERTLKNIGYNIGAEVKFLFNDENEHRMSDELLQGIRSKLKEKSKEFYIEKTGLFERLKSSALLGNIPSHDNPYQLSIGDYRSVWSDITELENVFYCKDELCKRPSISLFNEDRIGKVIRCGCGKASIHWNNK